jgi:hypothetical protein
MQYTETSESTHRIDKIGVTSDSLTSRAGLALFARYLAELGIFPVLAQLFGRIRKSSKGLPVVEIFKQILVFFADGTSRHLTRFDTLKKDPGYAGTIESAPHRLLSSHAVKRFFKAFSLPLNHAFRKLLRHLFLWRLRIVQPTLIVLGLDTVVLDNDEAVKRHGVAPTYKKVKGFQPLQLSWKRFVIDAIFRRGDKHSNHGDDAKRMLGLVIELIRTHYSQNVPIVVRMDSGFFDGKLFKALEKLGVGYVCGGRMYEDICQKAREQKDWQSYRNGDQEWRLFELEDQRDVWDEPRRAIFSQPMSEDRQQLLEFARPDTVLYTNLGKGEPIDTLLREANHGDLLVPVEILKLYHGRGRDELVHRAMKDFADEKLPFKRFGPNMAYYFTMLVAFFLFEAFQEDVCAEVVPVQAYPTTLRRQIFDQAGKIVRHAGRIILRVTQAVWDLLKFDQLWEKAHMPPLIPAYSFESTTRNRSI